MKKTTYSETIDSTYQRDINEVIALLIEHRDKGATHVITSGGYEDDCYIQCYGEREMTDDEEKEYIERMEKQGTGKLRSVELIYRPRRLEK